jgi:hypothetical protein
MSDIALNYSGQTGDLDLTGHRLNLITGTAAIEQTVRLRCRYFEGSWFLDERQGLPFLRSILIKAPDLQLVESLFRVAVRTTPGISTVNTMELTIDTATRTLSVSFTATMDTGEVLVFQPFIVEI